MVEVMLLPDCCYSDEGPSTEGPDLNDPAIKQDALLLERWILEPVPRQWVVKRGVKVSKTSFLHLLEYCSMSLNPSFLCSRVEMLTVYLWHQVTLGSACVHSQSTRPRRCLFPLISCKSSHSIFADMWLYLLPPLRNGDRFIEEKALLLAVRSFVFFSQLSAWLSVSHGAIPRNILYRYVQGGKGQCRVVS